VAVAFNVNVHVLVLLPPLEQAPDQIASRPFETLSVIDVPPAKDADPLLPTLTLIPAGLEVMRSPLRPVALTVSVTAPVCPCGVTVNVVVRVTAPALAVIVTGVDAATADVVIANVAVVAPCATVTLAGIVATAWLSLSVTANPPEGADAVSVTVPCDELPPTTDEGLTDTADSDAGAAVGVTVSVAVRVTPPALAVMVTAVDAATEVVPIPKVALVAPCATVTLAGTVAAAWLSLSVTANPPAGAAAVSVTVPCDALPPTTDDGFTETVESAAVAVAARGMKLRTEDHGPTVPTELIPRTRHQCCRAASEGIVSCDAVCVWSMTRGVENVLESSTWMR
jgi:hypothetical protein